MRLSARWKPLLGSPRDVAPAALPSDLRSQGKRQRSLTGKLGRRPPRRSLAPGSTRRDPLAGTLRRRRAAPRPGASAPAGGGRGPAASGGARPAAVSQAAKDEALGRAFGDERHGRVARAEDEVREEAEGEGGRGGVGGFGWGR